MEALEKVAAVYKEQGKYEEALGLYQKAIATDSRLCIDLDKTKVSQPRTVGVLMLQQSCNRSATATDVQIIECVHATVILIISFNNYN